MDSYREVFLSESTEYLQSVTDGLLSLERTPGDTESVDVIFRGAHSLKGMAAAMGYGRTTELTHRMESLMDKVRNGQRAIDSTMIDYLLAAVDMARDLIAEESNGQEVIDPAEMLAALDRLAEGDLPTAGEHDAGELFGTIEDLQTEADESAYRVRVTLEESCVLKAVRAYMVVKRLAHMGTVLETVPSGRDLEDERFERDFEVLLSTPSPVDAITDAVLAVTEVEGVSVEPVEVRPQQLEDAPADATEWHRRPLPKVSEAQTVRISIGHLDRLVDLVGELVILRLRVDRIAEKVHSRELAEAFEDLHRVAGELQHEVMLTRMVPVGNIFNRFPRMVRDLSRELGKEIVFEMEGTEIELDRTVLDEIGDPIVHLLRNSIDHGIEGPGERSAAGKPLTGMVRLVAARERDTVLISVSDDGRGMDVERIWEKACERGMAQPNERGAHSDSEIFLFACTRGFSTTEQATRISGRGVGLDAVKGKIEYLGGTLTIASRPGGGTEFVLRLPLTLVIVQALMVECRGQTFALPLSAVREVLDPGDVSVESIRGAPVCVLRDSEVLALHRLDALMFGADATAFPEGDSRVVVIDSGSASGCLLVSDIVGRQEIVVKPLSPLLKHVSGLGGATVLGDGSVALVIDPRSVFMMQEES